MLYVRSAAITQSANTGYTITGEAAAGAQVANTVNTYPASIPVRAGDLIGIHQAGGDCAISTGQAGDTIAARSGDVSPGTTGPAGTVTTVKLPVSAQVTLQPGISSVSPSSGSGGSVVTISGHDFTGASAVSFGGAAATSFTVHADTSITAVVPAGPSGAVDVTVTTAGGQSPSTSADRFTYASNTAKAVKCVVPKLKGKTLKKARKLLKQAHCRLGKIQGPKGKNARIKTQSPKAGTALNAGSKVRVTTKRRRHH